MHTQNYRKKSERRMGLEPMSSSLARRHSTTELPPQSYHITNLEMLKASPTDFGWDRRESYRLYVGPPLNDFLRGRRNA